MKTEMKIGIIGLDSSHSVEYATLWHDQEHACHVPGARIVAAFAGGSPDWELSYSRVKGFRKRLETEFGIPILGSIEDVVGASDAIMILSVDGRVHPEQFEIVAASGKPVYIDKPIATNVAEVDRMEMVAQRAGARLFSASVWRYAKGLKDALAELGEPCQNASFHGQWPLFEGFHGWAYYGIHQVELLYAVMGTGCRCVTCARNGASEIITGFWPDGRIGTISTNHEEDRSYEGWLIGRKQATMVEVRDTLHERYGAFLEAALEFFAGGNVPVPLSETRETIGFLEAAAESAQLNGAIVNLPVRNP